MSIQYEVVLTPGAEQDLEDIYDYIAEFDCVASADYVLDRLAAEAAKLARFPQRGAFPRELLALGVREYRQTFFKPYRIIYSVQPDCVVVHLIADGRRDMQALLARRLLGSG